MIPSQVSTSAKRLLKNTPQALTDASKGFSEGIGVTDFLSGAAQNLLNAPKGVYNTVQGIKSGNDQQYSAGKSQMKEGQKGSDRLFYAGVPRVATSAMGALSGYGAPSAAFGGALGGLAAASEGKNISRGIGAGAGAGLRSAGVTKMIAPVVNPVSRALGSAGAQSFAKNAGSKVADVIGAGKFGQVAGNAIGQGFGNVVADTIGNKVGGQRQNTPGENIVTFLLGATSGGIGAINDLQIDSSGFLRNKAGKMFDPLTGKFVQASQAIQKNQHQFVQMVNGNTVDFNAPGAWQQTSQGLKRVPSSAK